ncbi:D-3-phosphoglycerate dehydrogenase [Chitinophaga skermanii]|uniref:D-3-phosphoglycerate dehydrogenase n=1 Tax=Chitinophaga skermanii TaxID=331697 RepID=A0A327QQV0_9BACT|nr:NAD(P)-dependent oxidoreductase [Chitinophaga skermanii]RAJ04167.1 D-3-phosphoglycerate dehydrogenase [Chitinophaga skermanii]
MKPQVLITAKVHPYLIEQLETKGFSITYKPSITYDEVKDTINQFTGLIVTTRIKIDRPVIDHASQLQWIGRLGSGMELIDVPYAESKGIRCVSSPEGNAEAVGEQAVGMLLALANNIVKSNIELRDGIWERELNRGFEIGGKTIGIIGFGHTGGAFARKLRGFDVNILAYDKYKTGFSNEYVKEASLEDLFAEADIISTHLPLTPETQHLVNLQFLKSFAHPIVYINTSRGKVLNTADLLIALEEGIVSGACLDVLENEKVATYNETEKSQLHALATHPKVVITPHIAGYSHEASIKMAQYVLQKLDIS